MPQELNELEIREVSLVDHPACSSPDDTGKKVPRARIALFKRDDSQMTYTNEDLTNWLESFSKADQDEFEQAILGIHKNGKTYDGQSFPKSDFAYTPDDTPSHWKLRLTKTPGGEPDAGIVGAAVAALGKGFRGKKVIIPRADLATVKAKVKTAWRKAHPDKSEEDVPDVLKGETRTMTIQELESAVKKQEGVLATLVAKNKFLETERDLVLKMSKKQRKAYATMSPDQQKEFMAGDEAKRKAMCDTAMKTMKEKAAEDSMDEACKAEYAKAGPAEKAIMIGKQLEKMAKAEAEEIAKAMKGDSEGDSNEDEMKDKKKAKAKGKSHSDDEDDDEEEDDNEDLELRKQLARTQDRVVKAEAQLSEIAKRQKLEHFTQIAESRLSNTSGSPVEKGADLMTVADLSGGEESEVFKRYLANLETADKAMTIHYGEVGKAGGGVIPAEKVLTAKAEEIAARDKISIGKAMEQVTIEHPELYAAYEQDHRRALGARY